jgi:hypothetical protein
LGGVGVEEYATTSSTPQPLSLSKKTFKNKLCIVLLKSELMVCRYPIIKGAIWIPPET